jgi:hypothetical protein
MRPGNLLLVRLAVIFGVLGLALALTVGGTSTQAE